MTSTEAKPDVVTNGSALAAFLAAGIGAFAIGFFVILNEAGLFTAPTLYGPAGGVSGRTTSAAVVWLIAWLVLHNRWSTKQLEPGRVYLTTLILTSIGAVLSFPPILALFG